MADGAMARPDAFNRAGKSDHQPHPCRSQGHFHDTEEFSFASGSAITKSETISRIHVAAKVHRGNGRGADLAAGRWQLWMTTPCARIATLRHRVFFRRR